MYISGVNEQWKSCRQIEQFSLRHGHVVTASPLFEHYHDAQDLGLGTAQRKSSGHITFSAWISLLCSHPPSALTHFDITMADPLYPLFSIFAFLGFVLSLIPLPWHLQAWNSGTCYFMIWSALACLNQFINSVVWHGNALNPAPVWCEICTCCTCNALAL